MTDNPLSTERLLKHMANALPTHAKDDTNSDLSSSYEAIALFSHACMVAVGFRLIGFGEDQKMESECERLAPRLAPRWNSSFGAHSFLYAHSQSSMQYVVKVDRLGGKAEIRGIGLGDERISRFEITAKDYISSSALPLRIKMSDGEEDRSDLEAKLKEVFISPSRIQDLASLFRTTIIQKLIPGLHKEGYEETPSAGSAEASRAHDEREEAHARRNPPINPLADPRLPEPARPYPFHDPLAADPRRGPIPQGDFPPPGFDDEYDLNRPLRGMAPPFPGAGSPFNIGHDDLNPPGLGPHDPLRGSFIGGGGPGAMGGGMHPTFDDPLFRGPGGRGRGQGDPQVPPGARYDPIGPGDPPRGNMGGRPPNPFGGFGGNDFI
ncbi:Uncharacterized protein BP5553_10281 [Venustampulla echinocandica]|uniref:Uncharacterized protein n=1 Tax=Venustampulla echinocandica TaxID=2656787 RepID=A0A370T9S7_9HELO|nr:Uncharacterized protein BP5553_10281 [Venustampulla echinocandica]RDL30403.1 Uncharacterized protein BP5553_10281 [Venustampulla echinocandica]